MATEDFLSKQAFTDSITAINIALSNVQTVESNLQPVTNNITELMTVASNINVIIPVGQNISAVTNIDNNLLAITNVDSNLSLIGFVNSNLSTFSNIDANLSNIISVDNNSDNINAVVLNEGNIDIVATNIAVISPVGANINSVVTVGNTADNVNIVAGNIALLEEVASNISSIITVDSISADVSKVAGSVSNINIVAVNIDALNDIASNLGNILNSNVTELSARITVVEGDVDGLQDEFDLTKITNGSPATFDSGTDGQRKVDLYNFYEHIGVWLRYPKDMSREPAYITESIDEGLEPNDLVKTYQTLKANQDGVIYFAHGSLETVVEGGIRKVTKWKPNGAATITFTGDNRPELNDRGNGVWTVDVEKSTTNLLPTANTKFEDWIALDGATVTITQNQVIDGVTDIATRIQTSGGTTAVKYGYDLGDSAYEGAGVYKVYVKNIGINNVVLGNVRLGIPTVVELVTIQPNEEGWYILGGEDVSPVGGKAINFRVESVSHNIDVIAFQPQPEKSTYPTNFTEGTRPAPIVVAPDMLYPTGGCVFGEVDAVRDDSVIQTIFDSGGTAGTHQSLFTLNTSNEFVAQIFGSTGGVLTQANPFTWANNERKTIQFGIAYDATDIYLGLSDGVTTYAYTATHDINTATELDLTLGNNSSLYFEDIGEDASIPKTTAEFETLFERMI